MKNEDCARRGFSLIELLVVIVIIGMLLGLLIPSVFKFLRSAKRNKAISDGKAIVNAAKAYKVEYVNWPIPENDIGKPDVVYSHNNYVVLQMMHVTNQTANPKRIKFIEFDDFTTDANGAFVDPWGRPYIIKVDSNGDGVASGKGLGVSCGKGSRGVSVYFGKSFNLKEEETD